MSWFDEDETRTHGGTISSGNAEENSDTPDEGSTIGGDLSEATEENGTGEFTGSENTDWFNEGEETEGSDDTEMKSEEGEEKTSDRCGRKGKKKSRKNCNWWDEDAPETGDVPADDAPEQAGGDNWWDEDDETKKEDDDDEKGKKSDDSDDEEEEEDDAEDDDEKGGKKGDDDDSDEEDEEEDDKPKEGESAKDYYNRMKRKKAAKKRKRNCNFDYWFDEDGADPAGALEQDVDNGSGEGAAEPAEAPADGDEDVGGGVDTEATDATDGDEKGNTDWWNEGDDGADPAGALEESGDDSGESSPAEAPAEARKGKKKKSKRVRNWWEDDIEEPEGVPEAAEPVDTPDGVCPDGCAEPGDAEHVTVVETPAEDQPGETTEQMLSDILNTRFF